MKWTPVIAFIIIVLVLSTIIYFAYPILQGDLQNLETQVQQIVPNSIENLPNAVNISSEIQFTQI